jgi:hypothetical protein
MVNQTIWIGIVVGIFFVGIGISYAIFSSSYDPNTMKFQNQQLFDQMMSKNPKMTAQWLETGQEPQLMQQFMQDPQFQQQMFDQMNTWMNDPDFRQQMYGQMFEHQQFMNEMISNPEFQQQWMGSMMDQDMMKPGMMIGESPMEQHEMMLEMIEEIMEDEELRNHILAHILENQNLTHQMLQLMVQSPQHRMHIEAHLAGNMTDLGMMNP